MVRLTFSKPITFPVQKEPVLFGILGTEGTYGVVHPHLDEPASRGHGISVQSKGGSQDALLIGVDSLPHIVIVLEPAAAE